MLLKTVSEMSVQHAQMMPRQDSTVYLEILLFKVTDESHITEQFIDDVSICVPVTY